MKKESFDELMKKGFEEVAMNEDPLDVYGKYFEEIEPLLNQYGTVTYSLKDPSYVVIANKEFTKLVIDMFFNLKNNGADKEATKRWNDMLKHLEDLTKKYTCCIKITHSRCIDSVEVDVKFGQTVCSLFNNFVQ